MRRDWTKVVEAHPQTCRIHSLDRTHACEGPVEFAHITPRKLDKRNSSSAKGYVVDPLDICPLCKGAHMRYDAGELDLLPYLTVDEQARAVLRAEGIMAALIRLGGP